MIPLFAKAGFADLSGSDESWLFFSMYLPWVVALAPYVMGAVACIVISHRLRARKGDGADNRPGERANRA